MTPLVAAFKQLLVDAGLLADLGKLPATAGWQGSPGASNFNRYVVVYPLGGPMDGPLNDKDRIIQARIQTTIVGPSLESTAAYGDLVLNALSGEVLTAGGRTLTQPIFVDRYGPVDPEDTDKNVRVYSIKHIFGVHSTPTSS